MCVCDRQPSRPETMEDVNRLIALADSIASTLDPIARSTDGWRSLYRCRDCGALWEQTYPFSEAHGGGPKCLFPAAATPPAEYFSTVADVVGAIRRRAEDDSFKSKIGPEEGPEQCRISGCHHLRVRQSVMCRKHHFEMILRRPYRDAEEAG
jgi:hypothetical protein